MRHQKLATVRQRDSSRHVTSRNDENRISVYSCDFMLRFPRSWRRTTLRFRARRGNIAREPPQARQRLRLLALIFLHRPCNRAAFEYPVTPPNEPGLGKKSQLVSRTKSNRASDISPSSEGRRDAHLQSRPLGQAVCSFGSSAASPRHFQRNRQRLAPNFHKKRTLRYPIYPAKVQDLISSAKQRNR